ncbi:Putative secretin GspD [Phycisphaerales bacterium]|nr:Putative secretin GspD [Phycisphaerales bacterium]
MPTFDTTGSGCDELARGSDGSERYMRRARDAAHGGCQVRNSRSAWVSAAVLLAIAGSAWGYQPAKATPVNQPGVKGVQPVTVPPQPPAPETPPPRITTDDPEMVTLSAFSEPVAMNTLIDLVATTLEINVTVIGEPPGMIRFNAPVPVKKTELLSLLSTLLDQQGWAVSRDQFGNYSVHAANQVVPNARGELATTRVFPTPNMRPSSLKQHIEGLIGTPQPGPTGQRQYAYIDDLGVIVATDTPRRLDSLQQVVEALVTEDLKIEYTRIPLTHISASVARERALQLIGQAQQASAARVGQPGQIDQSAAPAARNLNPIGNLADRLTVDQQGNALIVRGTPAETVQVRRVLLVIDVPNELVPRSYAAGKAASQVAEIARGRGLGEVITIAALDQSAQGPSTFDPRGGANRQGLQQQGTSNLVGGPVIIVDENRGQIIYYGTESQQGQLKSLLDQLDTEAEAVVTKVYKIKNAYAEDLADIINGIITNSSPVSSAPLLPGDEGGSGRRSGFRPATPRAASQGVRQPNAPRVTPAAGGGEEGFSIEGETAFVYPDIKNNQLLVKAQAGQQPEFKRLIERLDLRRPQVYVEAKIIAVNADDRLRTAFETQLINASGTGGVFTQSFGLATYAATGGILSPPTVNALTGFTGAVIRNDMVPIVMTALANETDSRIISNPQLLVDDNEEAQVVSLDQQPTSTISRGSSGQSDLVTSGDYAEAGTSLSVTPQISDGGYMRLKYDIELSSFTGESQSVGGTVLPPPRLQNNIKSESITVPSDYTVVVGGLIVESKTKTVAKIPLLGDIPLLGLLFQDRSTGNRKTVLYVFLTPKILRDPTFTDLKLLTRGPQAAVGIAEDIPALVPSTSEIVVPGEMPASPSPAEPQPAAPAPVPAPASAGPMISRPVPDPKNPDPGAPPPSWQNPD